MEAKAISSKNNMTRYIAIGGIGVAIFGASYYLWSRVRKGKLLGGKGKRLPKDLVIKILTTIRKELYPLWSTMIGECVGFLDDQGLRNIPQSFKKEALERGQLFVLR